MRVPWSSSRSIDCYVFDLDGVLIDTVDAHATAWRTIAAELGVVMTDAELACFRGTPRAECLEAVFAKLPQPPRQKTAELLARKADLYRDAARAMGDRILVRGVRELLEGLRCAELRLAVASASREARRMLDLAGIAPYFDIISDGNFPGPHKPAPDQLLSIATLAQIAPPRVVVFDDAPNGVEAAQRAQALAVGIGGHVRDFCAPHAWLESLSGRTAEDLIAVVETAAANASGAGREEMHVA